MFDFFGLGQQGMSSHQQADNQIWGQHGGGEQVG
jgi:hypothetical protein